MAPVSVALVDDFEVVVAGVARMLSRFPERVTVREMAVREEVQQSVDIALVDTFAQPEANRLDLHTILDHDRIGNVAIYTWQLEPVLVDSAFDQGVRGYISKGCTAEQVVDALEAIHGGETVVVPATPHGTPTERDWPGRHLGLSEREAEVLALLMNGDSNRNLAKKLFISENTVKSHLKRIYRRLDVSNRTQAGRVAQSAGFHRSGVVDRWIAG